MVRFFFASFATGPVCEWSGMEKNSRLRARALCVYRGVPLGAVRNQGDGPLRRSKGFSVWLYPISDRY